MSVFKREEYERLKGLVREWNVDHYDIFELTEPNEDLEFHGVVRFFFQEGIGASVITKCIRVSSTATTREVIDVLIEKFRPDMRMLSQHKYALYEVHVNGEERRLGEDERPLFVQLNWGTDVREGRFLLRNENHPTVRDPALGFDKSVLQQDQAGFKRKLSKREKKEKRKRDKDRGKENDNGDESVANKLYEAAPETTFTRSISNPDAVMRRRRQQKLEKKLAQMNAGEGGTDSGGTLKIYGESLCPDVPYKTLFLSTADPALEVVREALEKYGLEKEDPNQYCLVEVLLPPGGMEYHGQKTGGERVLNDNECPLAIVIQHEKHRGHIIFQLRKRTADFQKQQKPRSLSHEDLRNHQSDHRHTNVDMLPYLIEINVRGQPKRNVLPLNVTEVVNAMEVTNNKSDYAGKHFLQLTGPDIHPRHCVIAHTEGIVTVTPNSHGAETYVEGHRIYETTMLKHGMNVQFGKDRVYRFLDPRFDEVPVQNQPYQLPTKSQQGQSQEALFGNVNGGTLHRSESQLLELQQRRSIPQRSPSSPTGPHGFEDLLPASIVYAVGAHDNLLQAVLLDVNNRQLQFKLALTYSLYMAARHLLSARSAVAHKEQLVTEFAIKTAKLMQQGIQGHHSDPSSLAFWMANSSEILHMFKQDLDIGPLCMRAQEMLAEAVQTAFHHLVRCLQGDLQRVMPAFLDPSDSSSGRDDEMGHQYSIPTLADVLDTLSATMTLLRRCRVNAALTIQLFSQLFHFINMWLFNILATEPQLQLCTRVWGMRLKRRLGSVEAWAEKQGLELAADCHLCRIIQAAHLLQAPKATSDDITNISSTCFKLNSLQLRSLLAQYIPEPGEPDVSLAFVERVVSIAENMADELTRTDGREVRLEEDSDLHLPFLLPEDGYSCETIRGIPNGLPEFVRQLENMGLCRFVLNMSAAGSWTVYMEGDATLARSPGVSLPPSPEIITIAFSKVKNSMGLSIVAAIGDGQSEQGIYIKAVVDGGAAALDGRLQAGDQLLEVDAKSLVGVSQDRAAELMTQTGNVVKLKVAKRAVLYHNLGSLLSQPSPTTQRAAHSRGPDEGPPPPYNGVETRAVNGYGEPGRMRAPSTGNIVDLTSSVQVPPYSYRRDDPRSKSTSNLNANIGLDRSDTRQQMKPAQSVGMLHHSSGYGQSLPGAHSQIIRSNDYENQSRYQVNGDPFTNESQMRPGISSMDQYQTIQRHGRPSHQLPLQGMVQRTSDRSSLSSRTSSVSNRDMRPVSAFYDLHSREGQNISSRPRSEDVGSKLKEWHSKYDDQRGDFNGGNSPPYTNIGLQNKNQPSQLAQFKPTHNAMQKATAHERLFNQQLSNRQPNLYENTSPMQHKPPTSFNQMHQSSSMNNLEPKLTVKPSFSSQKLQSPLDIGPGQRVDYRQAQPNLAEPTATLHTDSALGLHQQGYHHAADILQHEPRIQPHHQVSRTPSQHDPRSDARFTSDFRNVSDPRNSSMHNNRSQQDAQSGPHPRNSQYPNDWPAYSQNQDIRIVTNVKPTSSFPETRSFQHNSHIPSQHHYIDANNHFGYHSGPPNMLPPPSLNNNISHDLSTVPYVDVYPEDLQPVPPSSFHEAIINQKLADEQKLLQRANGTSQLMVSEPRYGHQYSPNNIQQQQPRQQPLQYQSQQQHISQEQPENHAVSPGGNVHNSTKFEPHRVVQNGYRTSEPVSPPNYQNINFGVDARAASGPALQVAAQVPSQPTPYDNPTLKEQAFQGKTSLPISKLKPRDHNEMNSRSAWDRDAKEKAEEEEQNELFKAREQEIADLEARPFLNPQDQERLRRLKTEHEFRRRVQEIAEKGDYEYEDDEEFAERYYNRERLIQMLKTDLEKSRQRMIEFEVSQQQADISREQDRLQTLERRLEMYEKDREEQKLRMQKRQEKRVKEHQDQLRVQRETRERQRQNYEENKRQLLKEEEKLNIRREEELNKRRQFEHERRQELQDKRDADEKRLREEIRREDQELMLKQLAKERQQRIEQSRPIIVGEEKRRLDSLSNSQNHSEPPQDPSQTGYSQYANVASQESAESQSLAPLPPERKSSYDTVTLHQQRASFRGPSNPDVQLSNAGLGLPPSALKTYQEPIQLAKKSVSFNTEMNTYKDRTPNHSGSSYRSVVSLQSVEPDLPSSKLNSDAFVPTLPPTQSTNEINKQPALVYNASSSNTPTVIGAQEVYRDPRSRIEAAKIASQSSSHPPGTDRMSFKDKMKYFAKEAGEDTIQYKPKSSKTLREIESQLNSQ